MENIELVMRAIRKLMERAPNKEAYDWLKAEVVELFTEDYLPDYEEPISFEEEEDNKGAVA